MQEPSRRFTDKSKVTNFVTNPYAVLVHQVITFLAPFVLMASAWVFVTAFTAYSGKLDENTKALDELSRVVGARDAEFSQKLTDHDHRISRLEDVADMRVERRR